MTFSCRDERSVDHGGLQEYLFLEVREFFHSVFEEVHECLTIFIENQTIVENTHALVDPQASETQVIASVVLRICLHNVLDDLGEVSQVELVVEFLGSGHKLGRVGNGNEGRHSCIDYLLSESLAFVIKAAEVRVEDLVIDGLQDFLLSSEASKQ